MSAMNTDDEADFNGGIFGEIEDGQVQLSTSAILVGLCIKLETAVRKVALNRVQWLLTVRGEKIRQGLLTPGSEEDYIGGRGCMSMIVAKQSIFGFWRGVSVQAFQVATASILEQIGGSIVVPLVFNSMMALLPGGQHDSGNTLLGVYVAYGVHEFLLSLWTYPIEVIHLNVASQVPSSAEVADGVFAFLAKVRANEENGLRALYRGYSYEMVSRLVGLLVKVGYQMSQPEGPQELGFGPVLKVFLLDLVQVFISYPFMVMGNRVRLTVGAGKQFRYQGIADLTREIIKPKGESQKQYSNLWAGFRFSAAASVVDVLLAVGANIVMA